ncbi:hypothetical protein [Flavobacterium taihuense]|uniref:Lipopolysaccharide core biosynthesis protein rfaS n=1 Tax=Flavobacterium taihuense TaxID=2857508 RepID=A0ABS6XVU7_9FLAO|nr:hypothetical protein [Flavobacterium taihuense]MBW4360790.1 hypothetical protein [Flavobacterium taihuense]
MKITIISYDNWGFNDHITAILAQKGHAVNHINFHTFKYNYPNIQTKLFNFILKTVFNTNIKNTYYGKEILKKLAEKNEVQDIILTIKGDFIDPKSISEFKKYTKKSIAYFNDSTTRCPKIKRVIPSFDEVYSFEKEDCKKYKLNFITNWIYTSETDHKKTEEYQVFNISSKDKRSAFLSKIAAILKENKINYKIIIFDKKSKNQDPNLEYITEQIPLVEVNNNLNKAQVLLDINRTGQKGLTFRVLESIGLEKKLITTNYDIKNYDFYNPNNILIIDEKKTEIPLAFFNNEYKKVPEEILKKYTLEGWINNVLN